MIGVHCGLTRLVVRDRHVDDVLAELGGYAGTTGQHTVTGYVEQDLPNSVWLHETRDDAHRPAFDTRHIAAMLDAEPERHALRPVRETRPGGNLAGPVRSGAVVVLARLTARPGRRAQALAALEPFLCVADDEPGTEIFTVYTAEDEPDVVWLHEVYSDDAAFRLHQSSPQHRRLSESGVLTGGPALASTLAGPPRNWRLTPQLQRRAGEPVRWLG